MSDTMTVTYDVAVLGPSGDPVQTYADVAHDQLDQVLADWAFMQGTLDIRVTQVAVTRTTTDLGSLTPCPYDHAHTRHWCRHLQCRDS